MYPSCSDRNGSAAVVLWPRARTFVIRAKASGRWAIGEIAKALGRGQLEEGRRMAAELLPFWSRVAGQEPLKIVATTLRVARALDAPDLASGLLRPFRIEHVPPKTAPALVGVVEQYGLRWFREACAPFVEAEPKHERTPLEERLAWLRSLPAFARATGQAGEGDAGELARWVVAEQWLWIVSQYRSAARTRPSAVRKSLARLDGAILGLVESSIVSDGAALHDQMVSFLTSGECPALALVRLLRMATETYHRRDVKGLGLDTMRAHASAVLAKELRAAVRADGDWSIPAPRACSCALCLELTPFLVHRSRTQHEWPLAQEKRAHVHAILDAHELPVTHITRRSGRPYTLVLTKTSALFEREAKERAAKQDGLRWLTRAEAATGRAARGNA